MKLCEMLDLSQIKNDNLIYNFHVKQFGQIITNSIYRHNHKVKDCVILVICNVFKTFKFYGRPFEF